jgi:hypothetical protein
VPKRGAGTPEEGRLRHIPGWHELTWDEVERARRGWTTPESADRVVDTSDDPDVDEIAGEILLHGRPG